MKYRKMFIYIILLFLIHYTSGVLVCYRCLVTDGCLELDIYGYNSTSNCGAGVDHCILSTTKSKVTGAVAKDYLCGGSVYTVGGSSELDGCFHSMEDPSERTERTICYCSTDFCNISESLKVSFITVIIAMLFNSMVR